MQSQRLKNFPAALAEIEAMPVSIVPVVGNGGDALPDIEPPPRSGPLSLMAARGAT